MSGGVIIGCARGFLSCHLTGNFCWYVECRLTQIEFDEELLNSPHWPILRLALSAIHQCDPSSVDSDIIKALRLEDDFHFHDGPEWWLDQGLQESALTTYFEHTYTDEITLEEHRGLIHRLSAPARERRESRLAKKNAIRTRRSQFQAARPALVLAILARGDRYMCDADECCETADLTIDHITPLSRGGTDELDNLHFMCRAHNSQKGAR